MGNTVIGIKFLVLNVIFLILAAHIERTGLFEIIFSRILFRRFSSNIIITTIFIFSSLYLYPVFIGLGRKLSIKDKNFFSLVLAATITGSIISPIGNQRNLFLLSYLSSYYPENMRYFELFFKNTFLIWISSLVLLNLISFCFKFSFPERLDKVRFRYKEIIFYLICLIFIIPFSMGKLNFPGFAFLVIFLIVAFVSLDTLKITRWVYLIPSLIIIPLSIIPMRFPLNIEGYILQLLSFISSGVITADFTSVIFSNPNIPSMNNLIKGVSCGALIPIVGSFEILYSRFFLKQKINIFIFMLLSLAMLIISLIIGG